MILRVSLITLLSLGLMSQAALAKDLIHDAEYYVVAAQNGEKWAADDKATAKRLADLRKANGGKPPNIVYILLDDVGYGEIGTPGLTPSRGYSTPNIDALAKQGMTLQRMYTEPACTPTRVAMMTGRYPIRTGLVEAKATIAGDGLAGEEITLAEVLSEAGYYTSHVGKWHMGDIEQAYANNQGFMHAEFPIHQQGQLAIMSPEAVEADVIRGSDPTTQLQTYTLDKTFVTNPSHMVTGVEVRDGKLYEIDLEAGEVWTQTHYREMNERYQRNTIGQLQKLAAQDKPFFLNYWPLFPLTFIPADIAEAETLNGGTVAQSIVEVDRWIGDIVAEVDRLGIADNTIIMVMGDNGPFMQYAGITGVSDRVYRGGKTDSLEGGVRVNAYIRWPAAIEAGSTVGDIIHVSDLFTTFAQIAGAMDEVPTDRVIDGLDQSSMLLLGDTHGRRDFVHIYEGHLLKAVVKNKYKIHVPPPGSNPIAAPIFDLTRDPREERPQDGIKYGPWAGGQFANMIRRHMAYKKQYPDRPLPQAMPYTGIENLRPETKEMIRVFSLGQPGKK
ncbi:MAG: sulfatase-like hydrolase/transferase [Xanthomonadales bacterium]|nr:sulfatase-like hydrolase/transferase [Xanthomonadales bacterium]MDH4019316.1 sulfatase-like hydrolase/transferase [Xanthomonadales bacterium]